MRKMFIRILRGIYKNVGKFLPVKSNFSENKSLYNKLSLGEWGDNIEKIKFTEYPYMQKLYYAIQCKTPPCNMDCGITIP